MRKRVINILCIGISVLITVLLVEIFLRINPKFGYIYESFKERSDKDAVMLRGFKTVNLQPSVLLGYENIPNCGSINSYGLVGKEYKLRKDNNTFRILLLGDSIAWQDISRQFLEDSLNNNPLLNSRHKFEIWNAGCPSYDLRRYALYLEKKGLRYKPDMVMIFMFMNDLAFDINFYYKDKSGNTAYYMPLEEVSKKLIINPFLIRYSYFYRFIILRIENYLEAKRKPTGIYMHQKEEGRYYMQFIQDMCRNNRISLFIVIFPYLKPLNKYEDYQKKDYESICRVVKETGVNYINLYEHLSEQELYNLREKKEDEIHPGRNGHILIGKIIYRYLLKIFSNDQ